MAYLLLLQPNRKNIGESQVDPELTISRHVNPDFSFLFYFVLLGDDYILDGARGAASASSRGFQRDDATPFSLGLLT